MNQYSLLLLVGLALHTLIELWLLRRHGHNVTKHRADVPAAFQDKIPLQSHQKAADYALAKMRVAKLAIISGGIILLLWTFGGGLQWLDQAWRSLAWNSLATGTAVILSALLVSSLLHLPLSAYSTFVTEQRFGFNRSDARLFISDFGRELLLTLLLGLPLVLLVLWLMQAAGSYWWIYVWLVWIGFVVLMQWAYPSFIAPLFNRFSPLEDATLVTTISRLLERCGFTSNGVFVMDGSTRSSKGNAYFSGFGRQKRIVFFDTLLQSLKPDEIEAVLAHELGHFKHRHNLKRMLNMAAMSLIGLSLMAWLLTQADFFSGLGGTQPSNYMAILLFVMVSPSFAFLFQPIAAYISRRHEFQADDYAVKQTNAKSLINALVKMYHDNANTLTPDPLYSAYHDSHPPAPVRIAQLRR